MKVSVQLGITICLGPVLLSACSTQHFPALSSDFGVAVQQDLAAQIADPDARYRGVPTPGSNGARAGLAQFRYGRDQVIQPASTATTTVVTQGGGDNSGAAPSAGVAASAGP